jgi:hypothetical protein
MKFCEAHWAALRKAIDDRGLTPLVAPDGVEATRRVVENLKHGDTPQNFDPLMGAHNAIVSNAMGIAGLAIMQSNADGSPRCPICFLNQCAKADGRPDVTFDSWIERAADDAAKLAGELGKVETA